MKKIIIMAAVLLSSAGAFAQHAVGSINVQPKVGFNIANVTDVDNSDPRIGLAAGVEAEYQATDIFSVSAAAMYSMQGYKGDGYTSKLDYINVPIMANVYVAKGLAVKLGVQPGFNVNNDLSSKNLTYNIGSSNVDVDFSIPVGLSYEFNNFNIDARYNWGLTKINDNTDSKNSVFQITLGYKIDL